MKITLDSQRTSFFFSMELEGDDSVQGRGQGQAAIKLLHNTFSFELPFFSQITVHPDLLALAVLTVVLPWAGSGISFPKPVSRRFAECVADVFGLRVKGIDEDLPPREKGKKGALAFSGGVDSFAAALILPDETVKVSCIRKRHQELPDRHPAYSTHAIRKITEFVDNAHAVYADLEHIVGPFPQYPTWPALSSPCLLLADHFDLHSVSFGSIMGAIYLQSGRRFAAVDSPDAEWRKLFAAAGLDLNKPVAGLTEIATAVVVNQSAYRDIAASCQFGSYQHPCMQCRKCLRKYFIHLAVSGEKPRRDILDDFWQQKMIRTYLCSPPPVRFHHIYLHAFSGINRADLTVPFQLFYDKLMIDGQDVDWCRRYYPPALAAFIPDKHRRSMVERGISGFLERMDDQDMQAIENFNAYPCYEAKRASAEEIDAALRGLSAPKSMPRHGKEAQDRGGVLSHSRNPAGQRGPGKGEDMQAREKIRIETGRRVAEARGGGGRRQKREIFCAAHGRS